MAKKIEGGPPPTDQADDYVPGAEPPGEEAEVDALTGAEIGLSDGVGPNDLPRIEPRRPALYQFHPKRWQVLEGHVVPLLAAMPLVGGVGNVKPLKGGRLSISDAVAQKGKRGWTVLPLDVAGPKTAYLYKVPTASGRPAFLTIWETAHAGSSVISFNQKAFAAWLRRLMAIGKLPAPAPYVLEQLRARYTQEKLELQDKVRTVPSAQVQLDRVLRDLEVVERELGGKSLTPFAGKSAGLADLVGE